MVRRNFDVIYSSFSHTEIAASIDTPIVKKSHHNKLMYYHLLLCLCHIY